MWLCLNVWLCVCWICMYMSVCAVSLYFCVWEQRALSEQLKVDEPEGPVGVGKNSPEAD